MPAPSLVPPATATRARTALVAVDLQVDFLPRGRPAGPGGHEGVPLANAVARHFPNVVLTQECHPPGHISFASSHLGKAPFDEIDLPYGRQILWPDHCVQDSEGARLSAALDIPHAQLIIRKGHHRTIDSYSTFYEADRTTPTGLSGYLRDRGVDTVYLLGLATDFCVSWSAVDAARHGFTTYVIEDACRALDVDGSLAKAYAAMAAAGVRRVRLADVIA